MLLWGPQKGEESRWMFQRDSSHKSVPAVPCTVGFDPASAGGDQPNDYALPEGYYVLTQDLGLRYVKCWLKTPARSHVHGRNDRILPQSMRMASQARSGMGPMNAQPRTRTAL